MKKLKVLDLFSGIGGFSLGLERTGGFETVAFCEIEDFPRRVLAKHWPEVPQYHDVRELTKDILDRDGITVDVITGGFPCQDLSVAGKQAGIEAERSGLWSEIVRLIGELRPQYVIVENVANLLSGPSSKRGGWFGRVLGDLAECGYDAEWENIPAWMVGMPHERQRAWIVAYPQQKRWKGVLSTFASERKTPKEREYWKSIALDARSGFREWFRGNVGGESALLRADDGFPAAVDRLGALGNAVVPQIPEMIGYAILEAENEK